MEAPVRRPTEGRAPPLKARVAAHRLPHRGQSKGGTHKVPSNTSTQPARGACPRAHVPQLRHHLACHDRGGPSYQASPGPRVRRRRIQGLHRPGTLRGGATPTGVGPCGRDGSMSGRSPNGGCRRTGRTPEGKSAWLPRGCGVDPISWTPNPLGRRYPLCRNRDRHTRRPSGARWSSWLAPDGLRKSWLVNGGVVVRMTLSESHLISVDYDTHRISLGLGLVPARKPHRQHFSYASRSSAPNIVQAR